MTRSARVHGLRMARVGMMALALVVATASGGARTAAAFGPAVPPPPPANTPPPAAPAPVAPMFGVAPARAVPAPAKTPPAPAKTPPAPAPPGAAATMSASPPRTAPAAPAPGGAATMSASPPRTAVPAAAAPGGAATMSASPPRPGAAPAAAVPVAGAAVPAAPPRPAIGAANLADARLHFQQGVALYQDQNYDAALAEFQGAYGISGEPVVLYNMGLTYKALFRYAEAIDTLERYLSESAARALAVTKERRAEVERLVVEMKSLLADVTIVVKPAAATVRIDGRPVVLGIEGIVKLATGSHVIEATAGDHVAERRQITVVAGTPQTVSLVLAEVPRSGKVRIAASQIGARVIVDGRDHGPSPVEIELPVGGHQVEVLAPGYAPSRSELAIAAGQTRTVTIVLEAPREESGPVYKKWWFWTGVGVVVVAGAAFALAPQSTQGPLPGTLGTSSTTVSQ
jgi:hypothetical protein